MSEHWTDRLSEYLDGELAAAEVRGLEAHLESCETCHLALRDLRAVVEGAKLLPAEPPASDLWPAIEARLAPRTVHGVSRPPVDMGKARRRRRITLTVAQLAAAGIAIMLFSAGAVWLTLGGGRAPDAQTGPASPAAALTESATFAAAWESAVADLEAEFAQRRASLDPGTILVVERNLAIIDQAIEEARVALESDPSSAFLNGYMADAMRRKVDLLRQATRIQRTES